MEIFENKLFSGITLGLYTQLLVMGLLFISIGYKNQRKVILGCFCLFLGSVSLYNTFWNLFKDSFLANLILSGYKSIFYAPLLYLYIFSTEKKIKNNRLLKHLWVPILVTDSYLFIKFLFVDFYEKYLMLIIIGISILEICSFTFYTILLFLNYHHLRDTLLPWVRKKYLYFFSAVSFYFLVTSITRLFNFFISVDAYPTYYEFTIIGSYFLGILIYFLIAFFTISEINQLKVFFVPKSPYLVKGFAQKEQEIKGLIEQRIVSQKLFKDKNLTAKSAAKALGIKENELKEYLRLNSRQNFNEFINDLRVNEFKKILETMDSNKFDIYGIANEVGFKSRSTFYRHFNEHTGITPGQYLKSLKNQP